jgi:hypothetical protein
MRGGMIDSVGSSSSIDLALLALLVCFCQNREQQVVQERPRHENEQLSAISGWRCLSDEMAPSHCLQLMDCLSGFQSSHL